jgi:hypothetical protein
VPLEYIAQVFETMPASGLAYLPDRHDKSGLDATYCLDDPIALQWHGADALQRDRVAAMSDGERSVLRAALDSVLS